MEFGIDVRYDLVGVGEWFPTLVYDCSGGGGLSQACLGINMD
jgi:hypothetical protein